MKIQGTKDTVIDATNAINASNSTLEFENVAFIYDNDGYEGYQHAEKVTFTNCDFTGTQFLYAPTVEFVNCKFEITGDNYGVWTYGAKDVTFENCVFNCDGKAVLVYNEGAVTATVTFNNCEFNDNGNISGKAAVEIAESAYGNEANYTINMNGCTVNGFDITTQNSFTVGGTDLGTTLWGNKNLMPADRLNIVIDGTEVY